MNLDPRLTGFFGIASVKQTPPVKRFDFEILVAINALMSSAVAFCS